MDTGGGVIAINCAAQAGNDVCCLQLHLSYFACFDALLLGLLGSWARW